METLIAGIVIGLLGIFYRNCLKINNMVFNKLYFSLWRMAKSKKKLIAFIAYPLGFCCYCSTVWIAVLYFCFTDFGGVFKLISLIAISHTVVLLMCVFILQNLEETLFDPEIRMRSEEEKKLRKTIYKVLTDQELKELDEELNF